MKPYFDTNHIAGLLVLFVVMAWGAMEFSQFSQGLGARKGATKVGGATGTAPTPRGTSASSRSSGEHGLAGDARVPRPSAPVRAFRRRSPLMYPEDWMLCQNSVPSGSIPRILS
jgi:hypothetical protein